MEELESREEEKVVSYIYNHWILMTWVQISALILISYLILGKLLNLSVFVILTVKGDAWLTGIM